MGLILKGRDVVLGLLMEKNCLVMILKLCLKTYLLISLMEVLNDLSNVTSVGKRGKIKRSCYARRETK